MAKNSVLKTSDSNCGLIWTKNPILEPFQLQRTGLPGKVFPVSPAEFFTTLPGGLQLNYDLLRWFKLFEHLVFKEFTVAIQIISEQLLRFQEKCLYFGNTE